MIVSFIKMGPVLLHQSSDLIHVSYSCLLELFLFFIFIFYNNIVFFFTFNNFKINNFLLFNYYQHGKLATLICEK